MGNFLQTIEAKRDGQVLRAEAIGKIVTGYTAGEIPDYQMAAFLMAVFFRGLNKEETRALTLFMKDSGDLLKFPQDPRPLVDKHSTGGVGDKVSLALAPLLACLGFRVPMISGRGLGITGGTLDKLDSIPGFKTNLPTERMIEIVQTIGCVICGQTERMVPADKKLYALRDVTGTVPSVPLIVASILSKKMAEGIQALVLDVKFGLAAFMRSLEAARDLAGQLVELGKGCGIDTQALLTRMDTPLGRAAGNWLEVKEATELLGNASGSVRRERDGAASACPHGLDDLEALVVEFAAHLLVQTKMARQVSEARIHARQCLGSGEPLKKWFEMLGQQGADLDAFEENLKCDTCAEAVGELKSDREGFVRRCDARIIGEVVRDLGGGRLNKDSKLDHRVGVDQIAKPGDLVAEGTVVARAHGRNDAEVQRALVRLRSTFEITGEPPEATSLIAEVC